MLGVGDEELRPLASQKGDEAGKRGERAGGVERNDAHVRRNDIEQFAATPMDEKRHLQSRRGEDRRKPEM